MVRLHRQTKAQLLEIVNDQAQILDKNLVTLEKIEVEFAEKIKNLESHVYNLKDVLRKSQDKVDEIREQHAKLQENVFAVVAVLLHYRDTAFPVDINEYGNPAVREPKDQQETERWINGLIKGLSNATS